MPVEINQLFTFSDLLPTLLLLVKTSALITSIANISLLLGLLYVYLERYREVKSKFTTTLVLFTLIFLLQNILFTVYFSFNLPHTIINAVIPLIFSGLEFIALALLLKITMKWFSISHINRLIIIFLFKKWVNWSWYLFGYINTRHPSYPENKQ